MSARHAVAALFAVLTILNLDMAAGQEYPNKTVRIVTSPAGGSSDFVARLIAQAITGNLRQPVVVENRPSLVGLEMVAKSPPDGYTVQLGGSGIILAPLLTKAPYDPARDFTSITIVDRAPNIVMVHPSLPAKSIKELIALAKARPGELNYGMSGIGGSSFLATELFKSMTGVNMQGINYKGSAPAFSALLSGEIQIFISDVSFVKSQPNKVRALAVTSPEPTLLFPSLPTVASAGLPGFEWVGIDALWAPVGTPPAIITRLNQEVVRAITTPDAKERILNIGLEVVGSTPEQLTAKVNADVARTAKLIKDAGIKIEN